MEITDEQKQSVARWVSEGLSLADIQKRLTQEFNISMTYIDVRFLIDDLNLTLLDKTESENTASASGVALDSPESAPESFPAQAGLAEDDFGSAALGGGVSVEVDHLTKVGSVMSGSVTFSDGVKGEWFIDQLGRLGLNPKTPGYNPTSEDIQAFHDQLQTTLKQKGF